MLRSPPVERMVDRPKDFDKEALHEMRSGKYGFFLRKVTLNWRTRMVVLSEDVDEKVLHEVCSNKFEFYFSD